MQTKIFLYFLCCLPTSLIIGQAAQVKNITWTISSNKLVITYDLNSETPEQRYEVLLTLHNGSKALNPTRGISGAIGKGILPRKNRTIHWWYVHNGYEEKDLRNLNVSVKLAAEKPSIELQISDQKPTSPTIDRTLSDLETIINFTPGISANTLKKGAKEFNLVSAIFYNQDVFNFTGPRPYRKQAGSQSSFYNNLRGIYGLSVEKNIDIGLDLVYTSFNVSDSKFSFISAGPIVRWRPLGALSESLDLTIQNVFRFVISDPDNIYSNQPEIANQLLLTKYFLDYNFLIQLNAGMNFGTKSSNADFDRKRPISFPVSFLVGYYPRTNLIFFTGLEHNRTFGTISWMEEDKRYWRQSATTWTFGFQYLVNNTLNLFIIPRFKMNDKSGGGAHSVVFGASIVLD